jgi:hypothetical protein
MLAFLRLLLDHDFIYFYDSFFVTPNNTCCFIVFVLQPFENKWSRGASAPSSRQRPDSQPANHK